MSCSQTIPDWNIHGVLPVIQSGANAASPDQSPYRESLLGFCQCFGHTAERRIIQPGVQLSLPGDDGAAQRWIDEADSTVQGEDDP